MKIKNQIYYLINLFNEAKFIIFFILIFFTSSAIIYYDKLEDKNFADIRITAIPKVNQESVDIFHLYESTFRDTRNFEVWKKNNTNTTIQSQNISGYQLNENKLIVDKSILFKNAKTYSRSIYLTIPANNSKEIRDFFSYAFFIVNKINTTNSDNKLTKLTSESEDEFFKLYNLIKSSVGLSITIDNKTAEDFLKKKHVKKFIFPDVKEIEKLKNEHDQYMLNKKPVDNFYPLLLINPPASVYNTKIKLSKLLFISTLLSLLSIVIVLIYVDYKKKL